MSTAGRTPLSPISMEDVNAIDLGQLCAQALCVSGVRFVDELAAALRHEMDRRVRNEDDPVHFAVPALAGRDLEQACKILGIMHIVAKGQVSRGTADFLDALSRNLVYQATGRDIEAGDSAAERLQ